MASIKAIRGMNDILPHDVSVWQYLEQVVREVVSEYGYTEVRLPLVEYTELFKRSIGEVTDIVEKEMYTFADRNGESLTLRPEGTAGCVRAAQEHGLLFNQTQRLWYQGPMFRYEKPQKGRYRQFHQIGVETFGMASAEVDAELICLTARLWKRLGIEKAVTLELNSLGMPQSRQRYRDDLVAFLNSHIEELDADSRRRLSTNPLRILDSKDPKTQNVLVNAPLLHEYLDDDSRQHFAHLTAMLDQAGVRYRLNPCLVRGLDYYNKTVFEWVTDQLGAQGTVCAGGRYDGLVAQLGGKATPAVGFAMGVERLVLLLEALEVVPANCRRPFDVYLAAEHKGVQQSVIPIAEKLRCALPGVRIRTHLSGLKNINHKARQSGAEVVVLLKEGQVEASVVATLWQDERTYTDLSIEQLSDKLADYLLVGEKSTGE